METGSPSPFSAAEVSASLDVSFDVSFDVSPDWELPESPEPLFPHPARKLIHMEAARTAERTFFFISALLLMSLSECLCMLLYDYMNKNASTFYKYNSPGTVFSAFPCMTDCSGA
jgi:hypothetical protein